jgi:hypothetical protein
MERTVFTCGEKASSPKHRCPLLAPGGTQCSHRATVIPKEWELPPYCVPGQAVCACCYEALKKHAAYNQSMRRSLWNGI